MSDPLATELGRRGGLKGGPARAHKLSPWERTRSARRAANARWGNVPDLKGMPSSVTLIASKAKTGWNVNLMLWFDSDDAPEVEEEFWAHGASMTSALGNAVIKLEEHLQEGKPFHGAES